MGDERADRMAMLARDLRAMAAELENLPAPSLAMRHLSLSQRVGESVSLSVAGVQIVVEMRARGFVIHAPDCVTVNRVELLEGHQELGEAGA